LECRKIHEDLYLIRLGWKHADMYSLRVFVLL
jgi:hypothetical protein